MLFSQKLKPEGEQGVRNSRREEQGEQRMKAIRTWEVVGVERAWYLPASYVVIVRIYLVRFGLQIGVLR